MAEPILLVAPSWIGDAILSEPLLAILREPLQEPTVDVLAPPWCAPVYARMRGVRNIIENPIGHREADEDELAPFQLPSVTANCGWASVARWRAPFAPPATRAHWCCRIRSSRR